MAAVVADHFQNNGLFKGKAAKTKKCFKNTGVT
jgi:hypothetical protein